MLTLALSWRLLFNSLASEKAVTIHHNWASSLKLFLSSIQKPPSLPLLSSHHLSNNLRQHSLLSLGMHTGNEQPHSIIPVQLSMLICFRQKCRLFTIIYMVICIAQIKILWRESPTPPPNIFYYVYSAHSNNYTKKWEWTDPQTQNESSETPTLMSAHLNPKTINGSKRHHGWFSHSFHAWCHNDPRGICARKMAA